VLASWLGWLIPGIPLIDLIKAQPATFPTLDIDKSRQPITIIIITPSISKKI